MYVYNMPSKMGDFTKWTFTLTFIFNFYCEEMLVNCCGLRPEMLSETLVALL
jgi:hypothetical protein